MTAQLVGMLSLPLPLVGGVAAAAGLAFIVILGFQRGGTLLIVGASLTAPMNDLRIAGPITVADFLLVLGFVVIAPSVDWRRFWVPRTFLLGIAVVMCAGLAASAVAAHPFTSLNYMARFVAAAIVVPLGLLAWNPKRKVVHLMASAYTVGAAFNVAYALVAGLSFGGRYYGLTTHTNFFGLGCLVGAALTPYIVSQVRGNLLVSWLLSVAGVISAAGVYFSGSRSTLGALVATALVMMVVHGSAKIAAGFVVAGLGVLVFWEQLVGDSGGSAIARILGKGNAEQSDQARGDVLRQGIDQFFNNPLVGNGFEDAMDAHNIYVQVLTSVGVIGIIGYFLMMSTLSFLIFYRKYPDRDLALAPIAYLICGMLTNSLWDRFVWIGIATALLIIPLARRDAEGSNAADVPDARESTTAVERNTIASSTTPASSSPNTQ